MQARELKSVYLKAHGNFLRLLLHKCYLNDHNLFNQVRRSTRIVCDLESTAL